VGAADGPGKLPSRPRSWFRGTRIPGAMAMTQMLAGLATRRWPSALEPVGQRISAAAPATSKSSVSRRRRSG
jgi:hypothetical protein